MSKPNKPKMTHSKLAKALGISPQLLSAHVRKPGAPPLSDRAGWIEFLATFGRDGSAPPDLRRKIAEKRLAILNEQLITAQRDNAKAAGEMVLFQDCRRQAAEAAQKYFDCLDAQAQELPPMLAGLEPVAIHKKLCERREQIRTELNEYFDKIGS